MIRNALTGEPYPTPAPALPPQAQAQDQDQAGLPADTAPLPSNAEATASLNMRGETAAKAATPLAKRARAAPR